MESMTEKIQNSLKESEDYMKNKMVILFGCTIFAKRIFYELQKKVVALSAIVDNDVNKVGKRYLGVKVYEPRDFLMPYDSNKVIIVCSVHGREMISLLKSMGYGGEQIIYISTMTAENHTDSLEAAQGQMSDVKKGMAIYYGMLKKYGDDVKIVIAPRASGDIFIACSFLKAYCNENKIEHYILAGTNENMRDIVSLYGMTCSIKILSTEDELCLSKAYMFLHEKMNIKYMSEWSLRIRNSFFPRNKSQILFADKFKYESLRLPENVKPEKASFSERVDCERYGLKRKKTVIIAPYAYSSPAATVSFAIWDEIVEHLQRKGFECFTVGYGIDEPPLRNTKRIQFPYREAKVILEYAGNFLASRSGLCDIVHSAKCKQLIVYGRNVRRENAIDIFSLKKGFRDFHGREIVCDDFDGKQFVQYVVNYFIKE